MGGAPTPPLPHSPIPPLSHSCLRAALHSAGLSSRFAQYRPAFVVEEFAPGKWWVRDGEVRVGLVVRECDFAELVNHDPLHPRRDVAFPRIYHAPTMPGDRVTMAKWIGAQATTSDRNALEFAGGGDSVSALFTEEWAGGRTAWKRLTWKVDPDFGYVLHCEDEMRSPAPESVEFCNFLPRGTTDDRPECARYPYLLWEHPSGRIVRWNQNSIGARALGALDVRDRRRIRTGGFLGYFGETDHNPAIELLECTPGAAALTCPNMLDEHLLWAPAEGAGTATRPAGANVMPAPAEGAGTTVCRAVYNVVSVPAAVGQALAARAEMLDLVLDRRDAALEAQGAWCAGEFPQPAGQPKRLRFYPMQTGVVADFETPMDPASTFRGQVFPYPTATEAPIAVVSACSHSGLRSLRLRAAGETLRAEATGVSLHVTAGRRYRLSAWVKTDLSAGRATLHAHEWIFTPAHTTLAHHHSRALVGRADWQYVWLEFTPGERAHCASVFVQVAGRGTVWVDDLLLEPRG